MNEEQIFKDFIATVQKDNYNYDVSLGKFPELEGYDLQTLKDYVATAEQDNYDYETVNAKFPEFFGEKKKQQDSGSQEDSVEAPSVDGQDDAPMERQPGWLDTTEFISPATQEIYTREGGLAILQEEYDRAEKAHRDFVNSQAYIQGGLGRDALDRKERELATAEANTSHELSLIQREYNNSLMADWVAYKSNEMGINYFDSIKDEEGNINFAQAAKDYYRDTNRAEYESLTATVDDSSVLTDTFALMFTRFGFSNAMEGAKSRLKVQIAKDYKLEETGAAMFSKVYQNQSERILSEARQSLGENFEKVEAYEQVYTDIVNMDNRIKRQESQSPEIFKAIRNDSEKIQEIDNQLAVAATNVKKLQNQIEEERRINPTSQIGINEYNQAVEQYNSILESRKQLSEKFNAAIESDAYGEYTSLIRERNELSEKANSLYEEISPAMVRYADAQKKLDSDYAAIEAQNEALANHPFTIGNKERIEQRRKRLEAYEAGDDGALVNESIGAFGSAWFKLSRGIAETPFVIEQSLGDMKGYSVFEQIYDIAQTETFIDDMYLPELAEQDVSFSNVIPMLANTFGQISTFAAGGQVGAAMNVARLGIAVPAFVSQVGDNYRDGLERGMDRQTAAITAEVLSGISALTETIVSDIDLMKGAQKEFKDAAFKQVMKMVASGNPVTKQSLKKAVLPVFTKSLVSIPKSALSEGMEELIETGTGDLAKIAINKWQSTQGDGPNRWYGSDEIGDLKNYKKAFILGSLGGGGMSLVSTGGQFGKASLRSLFGNASDRQMSQVHSAFADSFVSIAENQKELDAVLDVFGKDSIEAQNLRAMVNEYNSATSLVEGTEGLGAVDKMNIAGALTAIQALNNAKKNANSLGLNNLSQAQYDTQIQELENTVLSILAGDGDQATTQPKTAEAKTEEVQPEPKAAEQDGRTEQTTVEGDRAAQEGPSELTEEEAEIEQEILMEEALEDMERQGAIDQQRTLDIERRKAQLEGRPMPEQEAPAEGRVRLQFSSEQDREAARQPVEPGNRVRSAIGGRFSMPFNGRKGKETVEGELVLGENNNVELHSDDGRIFELGKYNEMHSYGTKRLGLTPVKQDVMINTDGTFEVDGEVYTNPYTDPEAAINRDENGNVVSVNLETANGEKRAFRGPRADAIAYNMQLAKYDQQQLEQELEQLENEDAETKQAFDEVRAAEQDAAQAETQNLEQAEQQETAESTETIEEAPKPKPVKAQKTPSQQKRANKINSRLKKLAKSATKLSPEHRQIIKALQGISIDSIPKEGNYILDFIENLVDQADSFVKNVETIDPSFASRINNEIAEIEAEIETVQQGQPKPAKKPRKQTKQPNKELTEQEQIDDAVAEVENNDKLTKEQKIEHKKIKKQIAKMRGRLRRAAAPLAASATHSAMAEKLNSIDQSHIDPSNPQIVEAWHKLASQVTRSLEGGGSASTIDLQTFEQSFDSLTDMIAQNEAQKVKPSPEQTTEQVKQEVKEELDTYSNIEGLNLLMERIEKKLKDC